ncbi:hypothetical protein KQI82_06155 [Oscillibacter sp. MSJ-2]|uniref:Uncharacterized protein n=1 Tax=Dysosmobacter acutus TaxID=2841504 RepID=A0ABS6FA41_9FIRM|nr:hypothetical protein [Dysosmobacter acutus]MBU5626501.1 hypothetical protein [Dysosmobacter acutus]
MKALERHEVDRIRELTLQGKMAREVADEVHVSIATVRNWRKRLGLDISAIRKDLRAQGKLETRCNDAYHPPGESPCWDCIHAVPDMQGHGCPWTIGAMFRDVPGWTVRRCRREGKEAVQILHCPMFERG